jgi:hypothetical protein
MTLTKTFNTASQNGQLTISGEINAKVEIEIEGTKYTLQHQFYIPEELSENVTLGVDFLSQLSASLDLKTLQL